MLASALLAVLPLAAALSDSAAHLAARSRARAHYGKAAALEKRDTYSGRATYYAVGLGACGDYNQPSDYIVALNTAQYGSGSPGPQCFKSITISYNGKTATAEIMDECPSCSYGDLDLSEGLFDHFASEDLGEFQMTWWFNDGSSDASSTSTTPTSTYVAPTSTYTPPTSTWTPTTTSTYVAPTSTYTPPTSTYTPPTSTYTPPASSSSATSASASPSAASTTSAPASSASLAASSAVLNGTALPDVIISSSPANGTVTGSAAAAAASASASSTAAGAGTNLVAFNDLVSQYGRLIVVSAGGN